MIGFLFNRELSLFFRHEQGPEKEIVPRFTDRSVSDRILRGRIGPGGMSVPFSSLSFSLHFVFSRFIKS